MLPGRVESWERELRPHWLRNTVGGGFWLEYLTLCSIVAECVFQLVWLRRGGSAVRGHHCTFFFSHNRDLLVCLWRCLFLATILWTAAFLHLQRRTGVQSGCPGAVCCRGWPSWKGSVTGSQQTISAAGVKLVSIAGFCLRRIYCLMFGLILIVTKKYFSFVFVDLQGAWSDKEAQRGWGRLGLLLISFILSESCTARL